jgi:hypothetical protein
MQIKKTFVFFVLATLVATTASFAGGVVYTNRSAFVGALESVVTDDFASYELGPDEFEIISDVNMSALFTAHNGVSTTFESTYWDDWNYIQVVDGVREFCWGCNGSGRITFPDQDVNAFGMDLLWAWNGTPGNPGPLWVASITYCGGEKEDINLPRVFSEPPKFFGVISGEPICTVHFGGANEAPWNDGELTFTNLSVGMTGLPVFSDGFESGNTSAWSIVVGQ